MNYLKMAMDRGFDISKLSDYEITILIQALEEDKERRERLKKERLIEEYLNKFNDLINELQEHDLTLTYEGCIIGEDEFDIE